MLFKASKEIMDPNRNGFRKLPKTVKFQLMVVLSSLWSAIFCMMAGIMVWLPQYIGAHIVLLLLGIFGTRWAFRSAQVSADVS
jgi:hypothetical protein